VMLTKSFQCRDDRLQGINTDCRKSNCRLCEVIRKSNGYVPAKRCPSHRKL